MRRVQGTVINIRFLTDCERRHPKGKIFLHPNAGNQRKQSMQQQIIYHNITVLIHTKHSIMNSLA
jgi:hypothetical protein